MKTQTTRRLLRVIVPMLALAALAVAGEPVTDLSVTSIKTNHGLQQASSPVSVDSGMTTWQPPLRISVTIIPASTPVTNGC